MTMQYKVDNNGNILSFQIIGHDGERHDISVEPVASTPERFAAKSRSSWAAFHHVLETMKVGDMVVLPFPSEKDAQIATARLSNKYVNRAQSLSIIIVGNEMLVEKIDEVRHAKDYRTRKKKSTLHNT